MDITEFAATRKPVSDAVWEEIIGDGNFPATRDQTFEYDDACILYERDGGFWPVAWWYPEVRHETLAEAEAKLLEWWAEFN